MRSSSVTTPAPSIASIWNARLAWLKGTPLGAPVVPEVYIHGRHDSPGFHYGQARYHPFGPTGGEQHYMIATADASFGEPVCQPPGVPGQLLVRPGLGALPLQCQHGLPSTVLSKHVDQVRQRA